jgi:hypothetical protein
VVNTSRIKGHRSVSDLSSVFFGIGFAAHLHPEAPGRQPAGSRQVLFGQASALLARMSP